MTPIEQEIAKLSTFRKPSSDDRQDYLAALARAVGKLADDEYEKLSDDAANWSETAIQAIKDKDNIPELSDIDDDDDGNTEQTVEKRKGTPARQAPAAQPAKAKRAASTGNTDGMGVDRYGLRLGSKVSGAVQMFETGAPMSAIVKKFGVRQNNILKKLAEQGHLIERYDGIIRVTHADDIKSKNRKVTAPKAKDKVK